MSFGHISLKYQGNINSILTLDNCNSHDMKQFCLPTLQGIKFIPQKLTSCHQPDDMDIIAYLKVGYKYLYLRKLMEIFDTPGDFERATVSRKRQRRRCRGIYYGDEPHMLYFMMIFQQFWKGDDGKYVSDDISCRCCRKADILPVTWNSDINKKFGSTTLAHGKNVISDYLCNELCNLI